MTPEAEDCVNSIFIELHEMDCIADDLEEIGDRYDEKGAWLQAQAIYAKAARVFDCMLSIQGSLDTLVREIKASEDGQAS